MEATPVRCPDPATAARMISLIEEVRKDQDSIGGVCEMRATGVPAGLGEPVFDKLKADLAKALLSLPAVTAFEYGAGFAVASMRGSQNNDAFIRKEERPRQIGTATNRHGGMLGGISSGEPIICRVAIKPTSSLPRPQPTVTRTAEPTEIATRGRHDPCLLPRFVPMGEAMFALVLVDHWLRWRRMPPASVLRCDEVIRRHTQQYDPTKCRRQHGQGRRPFHVIQSHHPFMARPMG